MNSRSHPKPRAPLDDQSLDRLALAYVGRYATTRAKLRRYLARKLRERGWAGEGEPQLADLAEKCADLGYVDDRAFAEARARSLARRGYGARRLDHTLFEAGIDDDDAVGAREHAAEAAWDAATAFARKRRIGPFAEAPLDERQRNKAIAAMLRAGHDYGLVIKMLRAEPGCVPDRPD